MKLQLPLTILLAVLSYGYAEDSTTIIPGSDDAFSKFEIVPDVLDNSPGSVLNVSYGSQDVNLGNEIRTTDAKSQPIVTWEGDSAKYYLLAMIDPDAPSRLVHPLREVKHWLVGNIPGNELEKGDVQAPYRPPGPPATTGLHRYIFLIYEQPSNLTFDEPILTNLSDVSERFKFDTRKYAEKYKLGQPIAGNFFQAKFDTEAAIDKLSADVETANEKVKEAADTAQDKLKGAAEDVQDNLKQAAENVQEAAGDAHEKVKGAAENVQDKLKTGAHSLKEKLAGAVS